MIIFGNKLVNQIRAEFDNAKSRIWIVVPFIGKWTDVKKIIGTKWIDNQKLDIRLITDIRNENFIDYDTIKQFLHKGQVRTLTGLHAKIYLVDNTVFLTSANLSGTAFSKRFEIGKSYSIKSNHEIITVFKDWWSISKPVNNTWRPTRIIAKGGANDDTGNVIGLKRLWDLPHDPTVIKDFNDYQDNIALYNHFKDLYVRLVNRSLPKLPVFQEIDSFFNFLFHEHPSTPSYKYYHGDYRKISEKQREKDIIKYHKAFTSWLNSERGKKEYYRIDRIKLIQDKLSLMNIDNLKREELYDITKCFHCMNSMAINRTIFLNPKNNQLIQIKEKWKNLLHNKTDDIASRMQNAKMAGFGKSAVQELVSWYFPDDYPVVNTNSNSGLKFFGYDINTY